MQYREVTLQDKYILRQGSAFMSGIQALVRLPLEQRYRDAQKRLNTGGFISGYRGSPLGGYDMQLQAANNLLLEQKIHFWPGLNEDLGATAVWGSQQLGLFDGAKLDGVFGIWYGKAPGVDRTGDVFKHANFAGTSHLGGALAIAGDDHLCKSSTLPSQSEFAFIDAEIPILSPCSIQDVLDFGLYGIEMSRFCGSWVALIALADTMDSSGVVDVSLDRLQIKVPDFSFPQDGVHIRRGDLPMEKEARLRHFKLPAAQAFVRENRLDRSVIDGPNAKIGIVSTGQAYRDIFEALSAMGIDPEMAQSLGLRIHKIAMPWPLEPQSIQEFAQGLDTILVVEHKRALLEPQIKNILFDLPDAKRPKIIGKQGFENCPLLPDVATIPVHMIGKAILSLLPDGEYKISAEAWIKRTEDTLNHAMELHGDSLRKPHFCSGCPHNTSTKLPDGSRALAGIGCHYMANFMPDRPTDMTSQMGGEGVSWIGQAPFTTENHVFANLGDGTYSHSGSLAIRAAVTAGVNITYKLLYNDAVAMTGGQHTESGQSVPQIAKQLLGEGVAKVVIVADDLDKYEGINIEKSVELYHRDKLEFVQKKLRETKGVSVLIYDQICATEKRRRIKRKLMPPVAQRAFINAGVCEGCGDCGVQSNCLSIHPLETEFGTKREIDQSSCNQDLSCLKGFCPSFVTLEGATNGRRQKPRPVFDAKTLPYPQMPSLDKPFSVIFTGVGGTGVTTISAILGIAAHIDGNAATTLDMTGLAQKGGQVLSHMRFASSMRQIHSGRVPVSMADAAVVGDLIVATNLDALNLVSKETIAIANSDITPTSEFILDRNRRYRTDPKVELFSKAIKSIETINAEALAVEYLYDAMFTNMILMGFAWQKGILPVSEHGIYRAIKLNQTAIDDNMLAFDLGRVAAQDPSRFTKLVPPRTQPKKKSFAELLEHRAANLTLYQDKKYADSYKEYCENIAQIERTKTGNEELSAIIASNLYRLMAYKDEYEVARLYCLDSYWNSLNENLGGWKNIKIWLAPPLFAKKDENGHLIKQKFGPWIFNVFKILKNFKFLRGTSFDIFGYTDERKSERDLIKTYKNDMQSMMQKLDVANMDTAIAFAKWPEEIKGYGHVKEEAIKKAKIVRGKLQS